MRMILGWAGILTLASIVLAPAAPADEPNRPTETATEANPAIPAAGHSLHGEAFDDGPRRFAQPMLGMGKIHFAVSTRKPEAQAYINQGVAQLHSFFYFEAERSFRQAAWLDPDCAMAYWGMAMANVNNARRARDFLKEGREHDAAITPREELYFDAVESFFKEGADQKAHKQAFQEGLEAIVQEFPDDIDARAWLAMASWQNGPNGSRQAIDTVIDSVLQVEPMHPGAHHYRIHLWDNNKPTRALRSAALYARTAPGIAHAWHMPGHTYTSLKRYADAAYQQEGSARVDHAYMLRDRVMPFEIHNYAHNNQWLVTSLSHVGRVHDAIAVARNLVAQPRDPDKNGKNNGGSPQRNGRLRWAEVLTRYELWDDLIEANQTGALDWSDIPIERREKAYTLGLAHAARGDSSNLSEQVRALRTLIAEESRESKTRSSQSGGAPSKSGTADAKASSPTEAALAELEGYQLLAKGEIVPAFERFSKANAMRPEALARAHLAARNYGFAEGIARRAVEKQPGQVPPLATLVEVLHAVGKDDEAREAFRTLAPLAREADWDMPVFRRLAPFVAGWRADAPNTPDRPTDDATAERLDLTTLGPLTWSPSSAPPLVATDTDGVRWSLADRKGRNVVLLFFLGGRCAHCMQQLELFGKAIGDLARLDADLVAIGTDDLAATRALKENDDEIAFPMPMLPDPQLDHFKSYRAYDDFEEQPLHAIYLIDARGQVRYLRISAEPFLDVNFVKSELARVNRMVHPSHP